MSTSLSAAGATGTVFFDGSTISIERSGIKQRLAAGTSGTRIPIGSVQQVLLSAPRRGINGWITVVTTGGFQPSDIRSAVRDANSVTFKKNAHSEFEALRDAVEGALAQRHAPVASSSVVDELAKVAELHRAGVLTDEEFAAKKALLLDRI